MNATEALSISELCNVKGGGEDLRRKDTLTATVSTNTSTTTVSARVATKV